MDACFSRVALRNVIFSALPVNVRDSIKLIASLLPPTKLIIMLAVCLECKVRRREGFILVEAATTINTAVKIIYFRNIMNSLNLGHTKTTWLWTRQFCNGDVVFNELCFILVVGAL